MPGRDARAACKSSMSAARSTTAFSTRAFCCSHSRPPSLASVGRLFVPPTYFCTSPIFVRRHVELRPPVKLQFEMLLDLPVLLQQLEPAIASHAVADVDHEIAFAQFEEAVDDPRQPAMRRAPQIGPAKQLAAAQQHDPIGHQPKTALQRADGKVQPSFLGGLRRAEQIAKPANFGLGLADDEHLLAHAGLVQFVAHAVDVAAETLDRFDLQPASRLERSRSHRRRRHRRKAKHLLEDVGNGVKLRVPFPFGRTAAAED